MQGRENRTRLRRTFCRRPKASHPVIKPPADHDTSSDDRGKQRVDEGGEQRVDHSCKWRRARRAQGSVSRGGEKGDRVTG